MGQLLHSLEYVFGIVTLLGGVIAIHEFGHFICAKYVGARVDTFSIGFGPKIFMKKWGETEYCLSLIPLGGYVKIHGQDMDELKDDPNPEPARALVHKPLGGRLLVFIGGPLFNYLLAIAIFSLIAFIGIPRLPSIATRIVAHSLAYDAGLRSGDQILSVNKQPTHDFEELMHIIAQKPEQTLSLEINRAGKKLSLQVPTHKEIALTPYGEPSIAGTLDGLEPLGRMPIIATHAKEDFADLQAGDQILSIENTPISSWEDMEAYFETLLQGGAAAFPKTLQFSIKRNQQKLTVASKNISWLRKKITAKWSAHEVLNELGLYNAELYVMQTAPGSPADKAGLQKGDRIISVDGQVIYSFENLRNLIQRSGDQKKQEVTLTIDRKGEILPITTGLLETKGKDPLGETIRTYTIGIQSQGIPHLPNNMIIDKTRNPIKALWIGTAETFTQTAMTVIGLKKLVLGEVSLKAVGGPIMIGKIAGDTFASRGWRDFLRIMAIISISLGVFNLLPIPILDGGHVLFALIESVRGKPLSPKVSQMSLKVGFSILILLMIFALYNDLSKVLPF